MNADVVIARCCGDPQGPYPPFPYARGDEPPKCSTGPPPAQNPVYAAVETCLEKLGLDRSHYGQQRWNPLGDIIRPGQQVLVKPNWVHHHANGSGGQESLITHTSVLRPLIDYALLALGGRGRLIIGDAPLQSADFGLLVKQTNIARLLATLNTGGVRVAIRDFRQNVCQLDAHGRIKSHCPLPADPDGYCTVDLGAESLLCQVAGDGGGFRVTNYDPGVMQRHHGPRRHEYLIAKAVLEADVIINVPKLKTHRKAGLTCCLKNLVGINGSKDYLPHHRIGSSRHGGDEYAWPSLWKACGSKILDRLEHRPRGYARGPYRLAWRACQRMARHFARDAYREGSWYGNDTLWRTVLDLNRIAEYARVDGTLATVPQRRLLNIVDGVIVGGGEGPLQTDAVAAGVILAGFLPAAVDACAARLIGLDPDKIPLVYNAMSLLSDTAVLERLAAARIAPLVRVQPPAGWVGHIELNGAAGESCPPGARASCPHELGKAGKTPAIPG